MSADLEHRLFDPGSAAVSAALRSRFGYPPFSVLNTREDLWQRRKDGADDPCLEFDVDDVVIEALRHKDRVSKARL